MKTSYNKGDNRVTIDNTADYYKKLEETLGVSKDTRKSITGFDSDFLKETLELAKTKEVAKDLDRSKRFKIRSKQPWNGTSHTISIDPNHEEDGVTSIRTVHIIKSTFADIDTAFVDDIVNELVV